MPWHRRTREIGIRMALGERCPATSLPLVIRQGALQTAFAVFVGNMPLCLLIGRVLASALFGISPADPIVLAHPISILAASALIACYLPARKATRVNPTEALRAE